MKFVSGFSVYVKAKDECRSSNNTLTNFRILENDNYLEPLYIINSLNLA